MSGGFLVRDAILVLAAAPLAYYIVALVAAARFARNTSPPAGEFLPPISILKPIRGLDRETYENYASFCLQDYPDFEILFCVADAEDPAVPVIQKIIRGFSGCLCADASWFRTAGSK